MADDPFAQYLTPKAGAPNSSDDPFAQYLKPATAAAAPTDLGTTAIWNKPANVSWSDYMLAHLAKPFQGANQAAQDYARTAVDAATFGLGDRLQIALTGNPLEQERTNTAAAAGRLGAMAPIVGGAMYAMGPGELGLAARGADLLGGGYLAGIAGSAAEGAGAGALGAAGHDESAGQGALYGGLLGSAGGALGGAAGRGGTLPVARTAADLGQEAQAAYSPLDTNYFNTHDTALGNVTADISAQRNPGRVAGVPLGIPPEVDAILSNPKGLGAPIVTGRTIQQGAKDLRKTGSWEGNRYADALVGDTTGQGNGTLGMLATHQPIQAGGQTGDAAAALAAGNIPYAQGKDIGRVDKWEAAAAVPRGPDVGTSAKAYLLSPKGQVLAPPGSVPYQTYSQLAATARPTQAPGVPNTFELRHMIHPIVSGLGGAAFGGLTGGATSGWDPARIAEEAAVGGLGIFGVHYTGSKLRAMADAAAQARQLAASRATLSQVGGPQTNFGPVLPNTPLREALRTLIFGQGARGAF
jgi:hypothetical protein